MHESFEMEESAMVTFLTADCLVVEVEVVAGLDCDLVLLKTSSTFSSSELDESSLMKSLSSSSSSDSVSSESSSSLSSSLPRHRDSYCDLLDIDAVMQECKGSIFFFRATSQICFPVCFLNRIEIVRTNARIEEPLLERSGR